MAKFNGDDPSHCQMSRDWENDKVGILKAIRQVDHMYESMARIVSHASHLEKLDALADIRDKLLDSATGRDSIPTKTAMEMFDKQARASMTMHRVYGAVIVALTVAILFLLTGQRFGLFDLIGAK